MPEQIHVSTLGPTAARKAPLGLSLGLLGLSPTFPIGQETTGSPTILVLMDALHEHANGRGSKGE